MLFLVATYGFRTCEVVSLTLDDIDWRAGTVRVPQRKTAQELILPLTDAAGDVLVQYLQGKQAKSSLSSVVPSSSRTFGYPEAHRCYGSLSVAGPIERTGYSLSRATLSAPLLCHPFASPRSIGQSYRRSAGASRCGKHIRLFAAGYRRACEPWRSLCRKNTEVRLRSSLARLTGCSPEKKRERSGNRN